MTLADAMKPGSDDKALCTRMEQKGSDVLAQSLCLACGLCCDGTLFAYVALDAEEAVIPLEASGIRIVVDGDVRKFKQPCVAHKCLVCTVYADRPLGCRSFQCSLLKRFEKGEITQEEAMRIIRAAKSTKDDVKRQLSAGYGNNEGSLEEHFQRLWSNSSLLSRDKSRPLFILKFIRLQRFLDKFFREKPLLQWSTVSPGDAVTLHPETIVAPACATTKAVPEERD